MLLTEKLLSELQRRLKIGNRRGVHLNAIPANSRYKFDLNRLSHIDKNLPDNFVKALLSELPLRFRISWKDNVPDLNSLFEEDQTQLVKITKAFENLINQTEAIESEKGINTFGFGFPILARRDRADNKLTVAPILIWSLRIKRTKEFNTWEILRNEEDPIYINEVLINHLQSDANVEIEQIPSDMLDDGLINKNELIEICSKLIRTINTTTPDDLEETFKKKLDKISSIGDKAHYDKLPLNSSNSFIDFGGLFSIFEVQKQNIINDYGNLIELEGININLEDLEGHSFQPISSVETDPSQQSILHSLETTRNILIQGPPGTGKSQTLTAVLINALENNKKTIVVCEKRTALEVLHNALIEKGLIENCVLIRDIVKDRKIVVDSVRDRIDSTKFQNNRISLNSNTENRLKKILELTQHVKNIKANLEHNQSKANRLISSINNKHQKLAQKLIGNKSWTDVVGNLLTEIKGNKDNGNLTIDKNLFDYSTQELNVLLGLIQKGLLLYTEFLPIKSTSFINSLKLIGDNPYLIEQNINEDFMSYDSQYHNILNLLDDTKIAYFNLRKNQLHQQLTAVNSLIKGLLNKQKEYEDLIEKSKNEFLEISNSELSRQISLIREIIDLLREIEVDTKPLIVGIEECYKEKRKDKFLTSIKTFEDSLSKIDLIRSKYEGDVNFTFKKVNNLFFKFLSNFSKKRKIARADYSVILKNFNHLILSVNESPDFNRISSTNEIDNIDKCCKLLKDNILDARRTIDTKINHELNQLNLLGVNDSDNLSHFFESLNEKIKSDLIPKQLKEFVFEMANELKKYINSIEDAFLELSKTIKECKNISGNWDFNISFNTGFNKLSDLDHYLLNRPLQFKYEKNEEFNKMNFLSFILFDFDEKVLIKTIEEKKKESQEFQIIKNYFETLKIEYVNFFKAQCEDFALLSNTLKLSNDIALEYNFETNFEKNKVVIDSIELELKKISENFDIIIQKEFEKIDLKNAKIEGLLPLPILQDKVYTLEEKVKIDSWAIGIVRFTEFYKFLSEIKKLISDKNEYFRGDKDLFTIEFKWFQYYNGLSESHKTIINELKSKEDWRKSFLIFYLNSMLVNSANLDLPTNDEEHLELANTLNGVEKEQLNFIKEFWYSKQIDAIREFEQNNNGLSVGNLYLKKQGTKNIRLSLRQIVQKDADLFTSFFPIILTSPDVASNLFKGMNGYFDIVMFDEASQLRIEDNLPAILKGKQIVIAGDEHQMPPSNYFSKVFDGAVEDEEDLEEENEIVVDRDNILLSCESLLEFGSELNFQKKHLDFHYRSRHPYLIDFSNYAFYNQRLKPLPNNFDYVPIKYIQVNGTFSEHTNEAEAEMVLSIIDKNINRLPNGEYPTVGIATFNIAQRNLIKSKILERQKFSKFEEFNAKIQELEEKGMFVKNLENIQGDERDVIILSTTYGVGKDRKFAQRFGPINHSKGYKLLNVIITRAKFKVYCCSSIPEQVFMNYKDYLTTEGSNNKRAVLYAYLAYCKAVSESNNELRLSVLTTLAENTTKSAGLDSFKGGDLESPFEEEVYQSLADHLGTEKLIPQLQFAGFRIDIVYDPKVAGVPKVAIECDGAKYHSSREAYLYDRHRQKILENHGFVFHRIWSTNWWRNSSRETTKLVDFIKRIESTTNPNYKDHSHTAFAFTDDIEIIEDYVSQTSFIDIEKDNETIQAIEKVAPVQAKIFADEVKLNSKVQVKYVNNGKDISIHIVSTENNKNDKLDGIQKVYYKSPLAHSLLGQTVGDIVKIGSLDNFVQIIKIQN